MKGKIRGIVCIAVGFVLAVTGAVIYAHYERTAARTEQNAMQLLYALEQNIDVREETPAESPALPEAEEEPPAAPVKPMVQTTLNGYDLIGILKSEEAAIELPVMASWDYELLQMAPCRYSGGITGGDLIILAHNFDGLFANLTLLEQGDSVEFIDVEGNTHRYKVAATDIIAPTDFEKLEAGGHPLVLFTCTKGGYSRVVVYCDHA